MTASPHSPFVASPIASPAHEPFTKGGADGLSLDGLLASLGVARVRVRATAAGKLGVSGVSALDPAVLERDHAERFVVNRVLRWDEERQIAEGFEERRFDALLMSRRPVSLTNEDATAALLAAIRARGLQALPWTEQATRLRGRIDALRVWRPELGLPDVGDEALLRDLERWLAPHLSGKRRLDALQAAELSQALSAMLDYEQRRALDAHAPDELKVPSGMVRRLDYGTRPDDPGEDLEAVGVAAERGIGNRPCFRDFAGDDLLGAIARVFEAPLKEGLPDVGHIAELICCEVTGDIEADQCKGDDRDALGPARRIIRPPLRHLRTGHSRQG